MARRIPCECGNTEFFLNWVPPLHVQAECTECGETRYIGESEAEVEGDDPDREAPRERA
jgi:hypothetical protein